MRFSSSSPTAADQPPTSRRFSFQESSPDSTDSTYPDSPQQQAVDGVSNNTGVWGRSMCSSWAWLSPPPLQQLLQRWRTPSPRAPYQSGYMTLVPLSGVWPGPTAAEWVCAVESIVVPSIPWLALGARGVCACDSLTTQGYTQRHSDNTLLSKLAEQSHSCWAW